MRPRTSVLSLATLTALAVTAAPAAAAPGELPLTQHFRGDLAPAAGLTSQACQASYRPGTPGVATQEVTVPAGIGIIEASSVGNGGDVDLAVFDTTGKAIAAGASPDAQEIATGWTLTGGTLRIQACRRDGDTNSVQVVLERASLPTDVSAAQARANPPQLVDVVAPSAAQRSRVADLGLDLTEHAGTGTVGVVLRNAADRLTLRRAGFTWNVVVPDLVAQDWGARMEELGATARRGTVSNSRLAPITERTTYRTLADYESELKALAMENPGLVKLVTLKNKTFGGRDVLGVEIAKDVNVDDGKPAFVNMGIHHAREWPAGENAMEWALELVRGVKSGDARITDIVAKSRNIIVPIINPDGFNASRTAGTAVADSGRNEAVPDTAYLVAGASTGGEYRRKNCRLPDDSDGAQCLTSAGVAEPGVDPNRNYGGLWGGPGADATNVAAQTYRGKEPFSEQETRNVKDLVGSRNVMSLITNHTTAGLLLRAPGLAVLGDPVDEDRGYKALGDAMAKENGYFSQNSFDLYDTTGTTEDWTYNTAGGFGFTFEVYCGAPNFTTGDCDDPAFHPSFARAAEEYVGTSPQANHVKDPGPSARFGTFPKYDGKGNSEAYKIAAESAIDETRHAILTGSAPAGTTLRLKKTFKTETFPQPQEDGSPAKPILFDDGLESSIPVGDDGTFRWHVNPSTRPIAAKDRGEANPDNIPPSPPIKGKGGTAGPDPKPAGDDGAGMPVLDQAGTGILNPMTTNYNDHPFTIPSTGLNRSANVAIEWTNSQTDWDMSLYEDTNEDGKSQNSEPEVASSAQGGTTEERLAVPRAGVVAGKKYVLRVVNFQATEDYVLDVTFAGPEPFQPGAVEAFTLTCEKPAGTVLDTQQVVVDRGQVKGLTLGGACAAKSTTPTDTTPVDTTPTPVAPAPTTSTATTTTTPPRTSTTPKTTTPPKPGTTASRSCASRRAFRVTVKRKFRSRVRSGRVVVNGKPVARLSRTRTSARVNLTGSKRSVVVVRLEMVLSNGRKVVDVRRYRPCSRG